MTDLHGLHLPLITPFTASGALALDALERLAGRVLDEGAASLVALGTTAEVGSLTEDEKRSVLDVTSRVARERSVPLIAGASTAGALAALAEFPEITAALTLVPPFVRPGEDGVVAHFTHLAEVSPVPLIAYDIPYRTGQYLSAAALRRLAAIPGVAGVKYAAGGFNPDTMALMGDLPEGFTVLGGDDIYISPLLALGAHGGILASAHLATADFARLVEAWHAGEVAEARALGHRLAGLSAALFAEPNPTVVKAVLHSRGEIPTPHVRLPLLASGPGSLSAALKELG
ncbi:dihydrodipicolinate synthase family protein [Phytomonospora sp. NPDC050363]|uniref:dihydrodipicolinate synthase family protein n=1 Tax=Phytomonospora sp. NPDC050363 TaxID=3155642 RepID=UPI0033C467DA